MKKFFVFWVERYLYHPTFFDKILSFLLLPFTLLYCVVVYVKYKRATPRDFGIRVISIGNLSVGGSGKTPLVTEIAKRYNNVAIILRGYGRDSKGLIVVKDKDKLLCDVKKCGDEALVYASKLDNAIIIVSEDRIKAIKKAKEMGASFVLLDDGYSKHNIKKLDFLIDVETSNNFCIPSGPYREKIFGSKKVYFLKENEDFIRKVTLKNPTSDMVLVTAIAKPQRLDKYLLENSLKAKYYFEDHYNFKKEDIEKIIKATNATSLLVTLKDYVKLKQFGYKLSLLDLELEVDEKVFQIINNYIK